MTKFDPVHKPKHYNSHPSGMEVIEVTRHLPFDLGNAVKYLMRHELKGSSRQDMEKALWYLNDHVKTFGKYAELPQKARHNLRIMLAAEQPSLEKDIRMAICAGRIEHAANILSKFLLD